jgi:SPP1 family predicted phage head-tail adaptor
MKPTPIGARGRRFILELPLESPDGFGGVFRSYAAGPQLWGAIEMLKGDERLRAGRPEQAVTHRITLRYRDGVTAAMRLARGLRKFAIRSASDPDGGRRHLVCLVEEITP